MQQNESLARHSRKIVLLSLIFFACLASARAQTIFPHFECSEPIYSGQTITGYKAYFGYESTYGNTVTINHGPSNFFTPNPGEVYSGQQTTTFLPGYHRKTFFITITPASQTVTWIVRTNGVDNLGRATVNVLCNDPANETNTMTYQGRLSVSGAPANSKHDIQFRFFDVEFGGFEIAPLIRHTNVLVTNGVFTVNLDLSELLQTDSFQRSGTGKKWMQIEVRPAGSSSSFVPLLPRQQITAAPLAVRSRYADEAYRALYADQARFNFRVAGDLRVNGALSAASKNFRIDHPLDPANKILTYTSVESPDMMNIYNGNVTTDAQGEAIVTLPAYFEALNRDFRYQLTVIGQFAQAIVAEKINGNRFKIRTDKPRVEVSWQVTGIRQDKYAEDNRKPVEEDKKGDQKNKCLYAPACQNVPPIPLRKEQ